ncbi:hypothetical protein [Pleionea sp. CnH1-48]|uniref:hypothetical protein n=1 Tax=Pleionea sp. CnH1-48 TaxID=2954494 RepID=UPI0020974847|nr:hypothetical protein [Pleionea sp. CnH1-48]MCO7227540.1 hypothetical protein [Pleionea sp. CnH1-48]
MDTKKAFQIGMKHGLFSTDYRRKDKIMRIAAIVCSVFILSACGSLSTNVAVLDPAVVQAAKSESFVSSEFAAAINQDKGYIVNKLAKKRRSLNDSFEDLSNAYLAYAEILSNTDSKKNTFTLIGKSWRKESKGSGAFNKKIDLLIDELAKLNLSVRQSIRTISERDAILKNNNSVPLETRTILTNRRVVFDNLNSALNSQKQHVSKMIENLEIEMNKAPPSTDVARIKATMKSARDKSSESISQIEKSLLNVLQVKSIRDDFFAYYVANAPEEKWEKKFNKVEAFGLFGDSDFIIVVDEAGNFKMKGISFNPGKVAEMASKVTLQSLILASSMSGISAPKGDSSTSDSHALVKSNNSLLNAESAFTNSENQYYEFQEALIDIAWSILQKQNELSATSSYVDATKAVKVTYEAHKARLTMSLSNQ